MSNGVKKLKKKEKNTKKNSANFFSKNVHFSEICEGNRGAQNGRRRRRRRRRTFFFRPFFLFPTRFPRSARKKVCNRDFQSRIRKRPIRVNKQKDSQVTIFCIHIGLNFSERSSGIMLEKQKMDEKKGTKTTILCPPISLANF